LGYGVGEFGVWGLEFGVWCLDFGVWDLGFRVSISGLGIVVWGWVGDLRFGVEG